MKSTQTLNFFKLAACIVLVLGLSASGLAQCGDSLAAMAGGAASVRSQSDSTAQGLSSSSDNDGSDNAVHRSIVGFWHVRFLVDGQTIQEAYQIWNLGGTEVHYIKGDPKNGSICLGGWKKVGPRTYKLAHRVWSFDTSGTFVGTLHLSETVTLHHHGKTHSGSVTLDFYDPQDKFVSEATADVVAERVSVE